MVDSHWYKMGQSLVFKIKLDSWSCNPTSAKGGGEEQDLLTSKSKFGRTWEFTAGPELSLCLLIPWPAGGTGPASESLCLLRGISRETEIIYLAYGGLQRSVLNLKLCGSPSVPHQHKDPEGSVPNSELFVYSLFSLFTFPALRWEADQQNHEVHLRFAPEWCKMLPIVTVVGAFKIYSEIAKTDSFNDVQDHYTFIKWYPMGPFPQLFKGFVHL